MHGVWGLLPTLAWWRVPPMNRLVAFVTWSPASSLEPGHSSCHFSRAAAQRSDGALVPGPGATAQILAWLADVTASSGSEGAAASVHEHDMLAPLATGAPPRRSACPDTALRVPCAAACKCVAWGTRSVTEVQLSGFGPMLKLRCLLDCSVVPCHSHSGIASR